MPSNTNVILGVLFYHGTMQILQHQRKDPHLNTLEKFHIHKEAARNNHLNDDHTVILNKIFEAIQKIQNSPTPTPRTTKANK
jgi:hypothetical protein